MKKYLIWQKKNKVCMDDGDSFMESFRNRWDYVDSIGAGEYLCGRIVTLDHEPTVAEVRTLLEGPDPLSECLELLECLVDPDPCHFDHRGGCQAHGFLSLTPGEICPNQRAKALLEKYREGGK